MSGSDQTPGLATLYDYLFEDPGPGCVSFLPNGARSKEKKRLKLLSNNEGSAKMSTAHPSRSVEGNFMVEFAGRMPLDLKDFVVRYTGNSKGTATLFRQINTCFECAGIELTPRGFFNSIIMRVGGEALEVLEQNRRLVECLNDTGTATDDDVVACKDLLMTRFAPSAQDTKRIEWRI
ncbi:hypothetical protein K3495_g10964 [Podosphaera aphanis]|nr:hypothetical protein K3495_g10964 [Podosphaera aphanis]